MGRVLYDEWAAYWPPDADQPFGDVINDIKKYVVSNTLADGGVEQHRGHQRRRGRELRRAQGAGRRRHRHVRQPHHSCAGCCAKGSLDELNLLVHPIAVGQGFARLFPPDEPTVPLELLSSEAFSTGVLNLSYGRAD